MPVGVQAFALDPLNALSGAFALGNPFNQPLQRQITPQRPWTFGITFSAAI